MPSGLSHPLPAGLQKVLTQDEPAWRRLVNDSRKPEDDHTKDGAGPQHTLENRHDDSTKGRDPGKNKGSPDQPGRNPGIPTPASEPFKGPPPGDKPPATVPTPPGAQDPGAPAAPPTTVAPPTDVAPDNTPAPAAENGPAAGISGPTVTSFSVPTTPSTTPPVAAASPVILTAAPAPAEVPSAAQPQVAAPAGLPLADSVGGTLPGDAAATEPVRAPEVLPVLAVLAGRIRAGETATPFSRLDEGLLEGFLAAPPQTDLFADREPLLSSDLAASLLTGAAPRPDLLPQEGSQVAPAATLLPAGAEQPGGSDGAAQGAPLSELFIDPTVIGPAPGALTAPAGEAAGGAALPAAGLHHLLLAGATVAGLAVRAVRQRIRRRRKAEGEEDRPTLPPRA